VLSLDRPVSSGHAQVSLMLTEVAAHTGNFSHNKVMPLDGCS